MLVFASAQETQLEQRVFEIGRDLRCPVCTSESVADSNAEIAIQMRDIIQQKLEEGQSEAQIKAFFQASYGDWILLEPPRRGIHLIVWLLPTLVGLAGVAVLAILIRRWTTEKETIEVDETELKRVREALDNA
ncbi:MAG: cytochrome c-type biogenesis protein CcmH [Trueperaceae bacterium]|nr:cytochrome c-type biogenesis protein CcmH [Trueperaceae bacterium]